MTTYYVNPRSRMLRRYREMDAQRPAVQIPLDVIAESDDFLLVAYVPGVNADDLQIEILENVVTIKGEFLSDLAEDAKMLRNEIPI